MSSPTYRPARRQPDGSFAPELIREFFDDHLPYRLSQLSALNRFEAELKPLLKPEDYNRHRPTHIENSAMMGRAFVEFLGIAYDPKYGMLIQRSRNVKRRDDVWVTDLGGKVVELATLTYEQKGLLARLLFQVNKATVHLTCGDYYLDGWQSLSQSVDLVYDLLKSHLYDIVGEKMIDCWTPPPPPYIPDEIQMRSLIRSHELGDAKS